MTKKLSVFSFEGFIFDYPVDREKIQEWIASDDCLSYPNVPDIPGPTYWDVFSVDLLKEIQENYKHDVIIMTEIFGETKKIKKRIEFLLKSVGINPVELIVRREREKKIESFYKRNISFYLTQHQSCKQEYSEVNIYLNDFDLTNMLGDYIGENFNIKTLLHDI